MWLNKTERNVFVLVYLHNVRECVERVEFRSYKMPPPYFLRYRLGELGFVVVFVWLVNVIVQVFLGWWISCGSIVGCFLFPNC